MRKRIRIAFTVVWLVLGAVLITLCLKGKIDDYWMGMGGGFLGVGIAQSIRFTRYNRNEGYREKVDISINDERNRYLTTKAWAWAGYLFVLIFGIFTIVFKLAGNDAFSQFSAISVCAIMVFYWLSYLYLKRKY